MGLLLFIFTPMETKKLCQFKIIVLGDSAVGKTSMLEQFFSGTFSCQYKPTIGTDFNTKEMMMDGTPVKMNVWDTAGQEQWSQQMGVAYYRGADAVIFVYDLCSAASLQSVKKWYDNFFQASGQKIPFFLVGNKLDKQGYQVTDTNAAQMAELVGVPASHIFRCSAKTGENVTLIFDKVAEQCLENYRKEQDESADTGDSFIIQP